MSRADDIMEIARVALEAARLAGANLPAFQALAKRVGVAAGGATEEQINSALADAVAARKKAGQGMHEAGKFRG